MENVREMDEILVASIMNIWTELKTTFTFYLITEEKEAGPMNIRLIEIWISISLHVNYK